MMKLSDVVHKLQQASLVYPDADFCVDARGLPDKLEAGSSIIANNFLDVEIECDAKGYIVTLIAESKIPA
jgi:hypothetical protein